MQKVTYLRHTKSIFKNPYFYQFCTGRCNILKNNAKTMKTMSLQHIIHPEYLIRFSFSWKIDWKSRFVFPFFEVSDSFYLYSFVRKSFARTMFYLRIILVLQKRISFSTESEGEEGGNILSPIPRILLQPTTNDHWLRWEYPYVIMSSRRKLIAFFVRLHSRVSIIPRRTLFACYYPTSSVQYG